MGIHMGIHPTNLPISPPGEVVPIRRVEPKSDARDFEQQRRSNRDHGEDDSDETQNAPADVVDVSDSYRAEAGGDLSDTSEAAVEQTDSPAERHIDISV